MAKFLRTAWQDSRPAVYAFVFAFGTGAYSFIHAHGVPKSHADWTVLLWSLGGIAFAALVRAVDPYLARIASAAAKVAFRGGIVVNQADLTLLVQKELDAAQKRLADAHPAPAPPTVTAVAVEAIPPPSPAPSTV
jgi:hypothetical protein